MNQEWDVSIHRNNPSSNAVSVSFPVAIGATLIERGTWRAKLRITEQGILVVPYVAPPSGKGIRVPAKVDLPEWST